MRHQADFQTRQLTEVTCVGNLQGTSHVTRRRLRQYSRDISTCVSASDDMLSGQLGGQYFAVRISDSPTQFGPRSDLSVAINFSNKLDENLS